MGMIVALILLGLGSFLFPPLWLVFLVVLLATLLRRPSVIVVNQDGRAIEGSLNHPAGLPLGSKDPAIPFALFLAIIAAMIYFAAKWGGAL